MFRTRSMYAPSLKVDTLFWWPSPSCPQRLSPQASTLPSLVRSSVNLRPTAASMILGEGVFMGREMCQGRPAKRGRDSVVRRQRSPSALGVEERSDEGRLVNVGVHAEAKLALVVAA